MENNIIVIEAPNENYSVKNQKNIKVFVAGGITNCPDWQKEFLQKVNDYLYVNQLKFKDVTFFNPRRSTYTNLEDYDEEQIVWEFDHLEISEIVVFWFSEGGQNLITMLEYGKYCLSNNKLKKIVVGVHPNYSSKKDVEIQTQLARPDLDIVYSIDLLVEQLFRTLYARI